MSADIWIVLILLTAAASGAAGFFISRRGAPSQSDIDALEAKLEQARSEAEAVQSDVTTHFEQSAALFGRLAGNYREFLEHFSESAQKLGLSEVMARELLQRADQPLLGHSVEVVAEEAGVAGVAEVAEVAEENSEAEPAEADVSEADVADVDGSEADVSAADVSEADISRVNSSTLDSSESDVSATTAINAADEVNAANETNAADGVNDVTGVSAVAGVNSAAEDKTTKEAAEVEPPIIDDVVEIGETRQQRVPLS